MRRRATEGSCGQEHRITMCRRTHWVHVEAVLWCAAVANDKDEVVM